MNTFNGRDQVIQSRHYPGGTSSSPHQDTLVSFDGHGRPLTRHLPIEDASTSTSWTYNADDTVATVTDPRGAIRTYKYGNVDDPGSSEYRLLLTRIQYSSPNTTTIPDPTDVNFTYDAAGNRTYMSDESGDLTYAYDELSRLEKETKNFDDTLANPLSGGYALEYTYHLTGGIKSIEDPFGGKVTYSADEIGRTTAIEASGFGSLTSFATDISHRAFGGVKSMRYSTTATTNITVGWDNRLRPSTFRAELSANPNDVHNKIYTYTNDGLRKKAENTVDQTYTQRYTHDFAGRLSTNEFGTGTGTGRYEQTLGYNAFSNITSRSTHFDGTDRDYTAAFTNNRKTSGGWQSGSDMHDAAGNIVQNDASTGQPDIRNWKFDAAGRMTDWLETTMYGGAVRWDQGETLTFDGDGRTAKRHKRQRLYASPPTGWGEENEYYIYSSVTGGIITELYESGAKTNIYMGTTVIAEHYTFGAVSFKTTDPVTGSVMQSNMSGEIPPYDVGRVELGALNTVVPTQEPDNLEPHSFSKGGHIGNPEKGCQFNYAPTSCQQLENVLGALGELFAGNHLLVQTWRQKHAVRIRGDIPDHAWRNPRSLFLERGEYLGSWWELVSSSLIDLPGGQPDEKDKFRTRRVAEKLQNWLAHGSRPSPKILERLRDSIPGAISQKCADFINKLMREHTGNENFNAVKDLLETFDFLKNSSSPQPFIWGDQGMAGHRQIQLPYPTRGGQVSVSTLIHELIHVAGSRSKRLSSDINLSDTVEALGITVYQENGEVMKRGTDKNSDTYIWYWAQALKNNCNRSSITIEDGQ